MKLFPKLLVVLVIVSSSMSLSAQDEPVIDVTPKRPKNIIKTSLTGIPFRNYSLQYERVLNKFFSASIDYRIMPEGKMPFSNLITGGMSQDDDVRKALDQLMVSGSSITPSIRFYPTRKGYGRGFYIAGFYRNTSFKADNLKVNYTDDDGNSQDINLVGKLTSNSGGVALGKQWVVGKYVCIDWTFFGLHFGGANGNFVANNSQPLSSEDQQKVRDAVDGLSIDLPVFRDSFKATADVSANRTVVDIKSPWAGLRSGISIGIRF